MNKQMISLQNIAALECDGRINAFYTDRISAKWALLTEDSLPESSYDSLAGQFGTTADHMIRVNQKHTNHVYVADEKDGGNGVTRPDSFGEYDGCVTNIPGLILCTVQCDCVPVYLYDPVKKAVGMVHSGWKGTAASIAGSALKQMKEAFGTDPKDVKAALGPHICKGCMEVGPELEEIFLEHFTEEEVHSFMTPKGGGKYLLDLTKTITADLVNYGLKPENITDTGICTYENTNFGSWRREHVLQSMLTGIMLR